MPKRWFVKRKWLVVLEATTYTRIYGQQESGKCLCVAGSQPTQLTSDNRQRANFPGGILISEGSRVVTSCPKMASVTVHISSDVFPLVEGSERKRYAVSG